MNEHYLSETGLDDFQTEPPPACTPPGGVGYSQKSSLAEILKTAGFDYLAKESQPEAIHAAITTAYASIKNRDSVFIALARVEVTRRLKAIGIFGIAGAVKETFKIAKLDNDKSGTPPLFLETEPWEDEVNGAELLHELAGIFRRYLSLPEWADIAIALWVKHTWGVEAFLCSPFLNFSSPEKRCGKSTALTLLGNLTPRPLSTSNASPAAIFRGIEEYHPTLIIDEVDTFLKDNEELNGILNSGHTRASAYVLRVEKNGEKFDLVRYGVFCPKAIGGIGHQKGTLEDRSIIISMKRKTPGEKVARLRTDRLFYELEPLRRKCLRWCEDNFDYLRNADPKTPESLNDRAADNWRPLLAIADLAGGDWPELARSAALALSGNSETESDSYGVQLLADIRQHFQDDKSERVQSDLLVKYLVALEDRPWVEFKNGKPMTPAGLARLLKKYRIKPRQFWDGAKERGYLLSDFLEAFARYLPNPHFKAVDPVEPFKNNKLLDFQSGGESEILPAQKQINLLNNNGYTAPTALNTGIEAEKQSLSLFDENSRAFI